jgi:uncharacterized protein (DUF1501 family)
MKNISRRKFLGASALVSGSLLIPKFLKAFEKSNSSFFPQGDKTLVIIQLSGGNDGLNTVIPFRNDIYYSSRPQIAIEKNNVLQLTDELGLNPALAGLRKIYDQGNLCIINGVGYPNPDHSHFRSMDIWHTASGSDQYKNTGWIGRYLDAACPHCTPYSGIEVDDTLSLALKGEKMSGFAMKDPAKVYQATQNKFLKEVVAQNVNNQLGSSNADYLYKVMRETFSSAEYVYDKSKIYKTTIDYYPETGLANSLKTIAELIVSGCETKVYYTSLSGFDTHVNQLKQQERWLQTLGDSVLAFTDDLQKNNKMNDVVVMTFSEFGRRVAQNASAGTDHGTANNIMIINGALKKKGFYNELPDLNDLDDGDLKYNIDFRNVYATMLKKWLGADDEMILGKKFEQLNFV